MIDPTARRCFCCSPRRFNFVIFVPFVPSWLQELRNSRIRSKPPHSRKIQRTEAIEPRRAWLRRFAAEGLSQSGSVVPGPPPTRTTNSDSSSTGSSATRNSIIAKAIAPSMESRPAMKSGPEM